MIQGIWFDMDGTIADLYGVEGWLEKLREEDVTPYQEARPLVDMRALENLLYAFDAMGVYVGVISWSAMDDSKEYRQAVRRAKRAWIRANCPILGKACHVVKYGTPKHRVTCNDRSGVLVDDNAEVREAWGGQTIAAKPDTLLRDLESLLWQVIQERTCAED